MSAPNILIDLIDRSYRGRSWHGTTLRGAIRGVTAVQASWRPGPARHNIHELVVHAAYWKYAVERRLTGASRGSFELKGSNWFATGRQDASAWNDSVQLLDNRHASLKAAIAGLPPRKLHHTAHGGTETYWHLISGIAAHDLYHAGQIQLLKRLRP